jgi:hypothetical protein
MAVLAMLLVPVIFNPANYYLHFVCLLPLLADEIRTAKGDERWMSASHATAWLVVLGMCVAQYWTVLERNETLHFRFATVLYFAAMALLLGLTSRPSAEPATMPAGS